MLTSHRVCKNIILWQLGWVRFTSRVIDGEQNLAAKFIRYLDILDKLWNFNNKGLLRFLINVNIKSVIQKIYVMAIKLDKVNLKSNLRSKKLCRQIH